VIFLFAYASLANFGLLNRERIQLLPFFFVLFALPSKKRKPVYGSGSFETPPIAISEPGGIGT
jgi:hypothetical protein